MNTCFQLTGQLFFTETNSMKNNLYILLAFMLLTVMMKEAKPSAARFPVRVTPTPTPSSTVTPGSGVRFYPVTGYTAQEVEALVVAEKLSNDLLKSKCFETFMTKRRLIETGPRTPAQVVLHLRSTDLTIPVTMYQDDSNTIGYRNPPALDIFTNRKYHAGATACARASNLTHEWSHSVGYTHSKYALPSRPYSVPYSINAAFEVCCACQKNTILKCSIN